MRNQAHTSSKTAKAAPQQGGELDAITLLTRDHQEVKAMFEQYEGLGERAHTAKQQLATQICAALIRHATVEEELFYPAVYATAEDAEDLVDEALVEHAAAKKLIMQLLALDPGDDMYDAIVKVLSEQIEHHVQEEEGELFPKVRRAKLDLVAIGKAIE
ncbi:MAG: hemerythrin domain-containing protein [Pseudomonadota bacterium]